ncbi:hypothetical protein BDZ45DRAFT_685285 [Acephala macrosclerotiorum]|nr:hypothetical protein BDZ45DRAFT_685285 [Acephala macrosclerotiorum]
MAATGELRESSVPVAASKLSGTLNRESRIGGMAGMAPELLLVPLYVFGSVQMHRIPALPLERDALMPSDMADFGGGEVRQDEVVRGGARRCEAVRGEVMRGDARRGEAR